MFYNKHTHIYKNIYENYKNNNDPSEIRYENLEERHRESLGIVNITHPITSLIYGPVLHGQKQFSCTVITLSSSRQCCLSRDYRDLTT